MDFLTSFLPGIAALITTIGFSYIIQNGLMIAFGTEIKAFADGVVEYIGQSDDFGLYFKITHKNGVSSFYAHCSKLLIQKGDTVTCGQTVALVGETGMATGPHLHLTIEKDKIRLDPAYYVDPS